MVLEGLYALIEAFLVLTEAAAARVVRAVKHLVVDIKFDILHRGFAFALLLAQCLESPALEYLARSGQINPISVGFNGGHGGLVFLQIGLHPAIVVQVRLVKLGARRSLLLLWLRWTILLFLERVSNL